MINFIHVITLQSDSKTPKSSCLFLMSHMKGTLSCWKFVALQITLLTHKSQAQRNNIFIHVIALQSDSKTPKSSCLFMMSHMKWTLSCWKFVALQITLLTHKSQA